ncbi:hypothetical protein IT774_05020 [Salinimonas marina]|uniref:Replication protein P n=1 Tax=Salinimonas marina TaxID=2785918 RepID=A0A7S9DYZ2_9ALTE|nr:hypothetical protein [Salinimonas marina]QPG06536.1 hypothetical protein IT774_05020 [Salinimonas marina]
MFVAYTNDFAGKYSDHFETMAAEYATRLVVHRVNREAMARGIERFKKQCHGANKWTPNPEEFARMCILQPEDLGIPSFDNAVIEIERARIASRQGKQVEYTHRIVRLMDARIGANLYTAPSRKDFLAMAKPEYTHWVSVAMAGQLPPERLAIGHTIENELPAHLKNVKALDDDTPLSRRLKSLREAAQDRRGDEK